MFKLENTNNLCIQKLILLRIPKIKLLQLHNKYVPVNNIKFYRQIISCFLISINHFLPVHLFESFCAILENIDLYLILFVNAK